MKIRKGELAQTQRLRPGDGEGPLEPDEIFDFDPVKDQQAPLESPVWDLNDPSRG